MPLWAQLLVRHLDDDVKTKLQHCVRCHGHSTDEEVREILRNDPLSTAVDLEAMEAGITISEWFEGQARRV